VRIGEKTGRLDKALNQVAHISEGSQMRAAQLRAALVYPAFVLLVCTLFVLFAPAAMMSSQLKLLEELHTELPWPSRVFLNIMGVFGHPLLWLSLVVLGGLIWRNPSWRARILRLCLQVAGRWGPVGRILQSYAMCQWTQAMALQLDSGITVADSLTLSAKVSPPEIRAQTLRLREDLIQGADFWKALQINRFPQLTVDMVRTGDESGQLPRMLLWLFEHYQKEFQNSLDRLAQLLEPLVMLVLGILAAVVMLLTLMPMAKALESL
jgi:type II secretory pathway component PulF